MSFEDKVVIVTGASSGIGAVVAVDFSKNGADVVIVGRNVDKLNAVGEEIKKVGKQPLVIAADISKDDEAEKLIESTVNAYGRIDVLVNNAGFGTIAGIQQEDAIEIYDRIMNTNLRAVFVLTHYAAPYLIKKKGNIVNISSILSTVPTKRMAAYCASKAALDHMSRTLAFSLGPHGVRVNTVNPGPVKTDFFSRLGVGEEAGLAVLENVKQKLPLKRYSDAEEVSEIVQFLASNKARGVTGSSYEVDNGNKMVSIS